MAVEIGLGRTSLRLESSGALWWERHQMLVVADLHLEKGAAFARRGAMLPPYDTQTTLTRLEALVGRHRPKIVVSLGDGLHDRRGAEALDRRSAERIRELTGALRWLWVAGNHDPVPPEGLLPPFAVPACPPAPTPALPPLVAPPTPPVVAPPIPPDGAPPAPPLPAAPPLPPPPLPPVPPLSAGANSQESTLKPPPVK